MIAFNHVPCNLKKGISSKFGYRVHPITGKKSFHYGIDIRPTTLGKEGDPLYAVSDGIIRVNKVDGSGINAGYGCYMIVDHGLFCTLYAHMKEKSNLNVGTKVKSGQLIGKMGTTGASTGVHLHFGLKQGNYMNYHNNEFIDPTKYLKVEEQIMTEAEVKNVIDQYLIDKGNEPMTEDWQHNVWTEAQSKGITSNGERPMGLITRVEAAAMVLNALKIKENNDGK